MTDRLCINCEHFARATFPSFRGPNSWCRRPVGEGTNLVSGDYIRRKSVCPFAERRRTSFFDKLVGIERCGPEGRFFEQAEPATPPSGGGGGK